jgi:hypothetical protein
MMQKIFACWLDPRCVVSHVLNVNVGYIHIRNEDGHMETIHDKATGERKGAIQIISWFHRARDTLDGYGSGAWIAAMVIGFVVLWPVGLALLTYLIWSGRMGSWRSCGRKSHKRSSGNTAFDAYREATLKRLEEEREAFEAFVDRLRAAKDKAEFEQFMAERNKPTMQESSAY